MVDGALAGVGVTLMLLVVVVADVVGAGLDDAPLPKELKNAESRF